MRDFTLEIYELIFKSFDLQGYRFLTFEEYISNHKKKVVIFKHDVDKLPNNALQMAELENKLGIKTSYYFRTIDLVYDESIIEKIAILGHEVSYHYEDMSLCRGNYELAIKNFELNLRKFRRFYPAKTICMHGSPLSKYDNKKIWDKYNYRDYGIIADPSFDIDYDEVFYITDTGRSWNNSNASVRDKVIKTEVRGRRSEVAGRKTQQFDITIKDTNHLIEKIKNNELPDKIMINVHPQRWNDEFIPWASELVRQRVKNVIKRILVKRNG
jgi:hypothetical protein